MRATDLRGVDLKETTVEWSDIKEAIR
jgi:hypothetical protein